MLANLNRYLHMMREYYETEVRICNVYQEREKIARELITMSQSFDLDKFRVSGGALVLKLRMLTVQLVYAVRRWKELVKRATATFSLGQARHGTDLGRHVSALKRNEGRQQIQSLQTSRGVFKAGRNAQSRQNV